MGAEWWGLIGTFTVMGLILVSGIIMIKYMKNKKKN
jgi:hypothetical protein